MIASHPMRLGPAILHHLKQGKPVEHISVSITHKTVHYIFQGDVLEQSGVTGLTHGNAIIARTIRERCPLELVLAEGADMERKIDCSNFEVLWQRIDVRTDEQKQADKRVKAAIAPAVTPPEVTQEEQEMADSVFASYYALAATEYRLLQRQVVHEQIRQQIRQRKAQEQSQDTPHE